MLCVCQEIINKDEWLMDAKIKFKQYSFYYIRDRSIYKVRSYTNQLKYDANRIVSLYQCKYG